MLRPDNASGSPPKSRWFVSTDWLAEHLKDRNVAVVDGSYLVLQKRDARAEYLKEHIPGAVFFDVDAIADHSTELPHMLPGPAQFGEATGALGIGNDTTVVIYDSVGLYSAPRVWWTFRVFGARNVYILDGGLPKWKAEGRPLEAGEGKRTPQTFNAEMNVSAVATLADMRMAVTDAERADRFAELLGPGQHMRQFGGVVAHRLDVEEHRARDVTAVVFGMGIAFLRRQEVRPVDGDDIAIAQALRQPVGRLQPTVRRQRGGVRIGSQHGSRLRFMEASTLTRA